MTHKHITSTEALETVDHAERRYLAGFALGSVVIRRARPRDPSA
jgi:hypothetical protein